MPVTNRILPYALCELVREKVLSLALQHEEDDVSPPVYAGTLPNYDDAPDQLSDDLAETIAPKNAMGILLPQGTDGLLPSSTYSLQILIRHDRLTPDGEQGKRVAAWYAERLYEALHRTRVAASDFPDATFDEVEREWVFMVANHPPSPYYWDSRNLVVFSLNFTCTGVG